MNKALLLYAHPNQQASRANRAIVEELRQVPGLTLIPLYERYPEYFIDVAREQKLLVEHQLIIWQHPLYWYSMPPLMKLWMDQVLAYDFAYGPAGNALKGKRLLLSLTVGGSRGAYVPGGVHGHPIQNYLAPYEQVARFCELEWQPPAILFESLDASDEALAEHARGLRERIELLLSINHAGGES